MVTQKVSGITKFACVMTSLAAFLLLSACGLGCRSNDYCSDGSCGPAGVAPGPGSYSAPAYLGSTPKMMPSSGGQGFQTGQPVTSGGTFQGSGTR